MALDHSRTGLLFRALFGWLGAFAGWTAASVPLTLAGLPFAALWLAFGAAVLGAVIGARHGARLAIAGEFALPRPASLVAGFRQSLPWMLGTGLYALAAAYFVKSSNAMPLWAVITGLALAVLIAIRKAAPESGQDAADISPAKISYLVLGLLTGGILLLYIGLNRPDSDDAFYLNLVIGLRSSDAGMMVEDTMYGVPGWPILGSNYRVEALPTLAAALSWATGLSAVDVAHGVLPILWCLAWTMTLAAIGLGLFGKRWPVFVILSVLATLAFAGTLQTWGTHGVARLFHGKAPLLLIVVPLTVHTALLARQNRISLQTALILLALLQIAAVGLTANAIYLAPLTLGVTLAAAFLVQPALRQSLILISPAAFPLLAGLWILYFDPPVVAGLGKDVSDLSLWDMAGQKTTLGLLLVTILAATLAALLVPKGRILAAFVLATAVLVVNPVTWPIFEAHITGGLSFRVWWALPVPMLLAFMLTFASSMAPWPNQASAAAIAGLAAMAFLPSGLIGMNETALKPSLHKLPPEAEIAQSVVELGGPVMTLAPEAIAAWMPTFEAGPPLVFSRSLYLFHSAQIVPADVIAPRVLLADWIDGRSTPPMTEVLGALTKLCVETLVLPDDRIEDVPGATSLGKMRGYQVFRLQGCPT